MSISSIPCPANVWTKVVDDQKQGRLRTTLTDPSKYFFTIKISGDPEPNKSIETGTLFAGPVMDFQFREQVDIYIYAFDRAGIVEFNDDSPYTDVIIQDPFSPVVDLYAFIQAGTFDLASPVSIDDTDFIAVDASAMTIGDVVCFQEGESFMQALILDIVLNNVFIDTPFDFPFTTSGGCSYGDKNLNVNGSLSTLIAKVGPGNLDPGVKWDIVRVVFSLTDQSAMDDAKFGGIPALIKGIVLRTVNGITKNIFNVKTNGQMRLRNFDAVYTDKAPAGFYGFSSRRTFGGQDKNGVVLRLKSDTNDETQILIQDDLTDLDTFEIIIQGHLVD